MSSSFGKNIRISLFGESHGNSVGAVIDGLPSGISLNFEEIRRELNRRKPGASLLTTQRKESDDFEIVSGYFNDHTTGTPLTVIFKNSDTHSKDYSQLKEIFRPSHADYTGHIKYGGFHDFRGGGHFSARLTAPIVFAGAIAKQMLDARGIEVLARIRSIAECKDIPFDDIQEHRSELKQIQNKIVMMLDSTKEREATQRIEMARNSGDSVGGVVECFVYGMPPGVGEPFFDSLESHLAHLIFSIPGVKGVEFGTGFDITLLKGSVANDAFYQEGTRVSTHTNHSGGVQGGISNGMPIKCSVAFKPTASIFQEQHTVTTQGENTTLKLTGRHDPCIVLRGIVVVEAICAIGILDFMV